MSNIIKLLKNGYFRMFFLSTLIAYIGINIGLIGLNWIIIDSGMSNQSLALYTTISIVTTIVISIISGAIIDRHNCFWIMKSTILIQGIMLAIIYLVMMVWEGMIAFFLIAIVNSAALVFYNTSSRGALKYILEKEELVYGNSIIEFCIQGGAILASLVTGIIYKELGSKSIFAVLIISTIIAGTVLKVKQYTVEKENHQYIEDIKGGMLYLANNKSILMLGIVTFLPVVVTLASNNVLPGYVKNIIDADSMVYGVTDMLFGCGAFFAGIVVVEIIELSKMKRVTISMFVGSIIALSALCFIYNKYYLFVLYIMFGICNTSLKIILNTIFMNVVPEEKFARAYTTCNAISSIMQIMLIQILGFLMDKYSPAYGYAILSFTMLVTVILFIKNKSIDEINAIEKKFET